MDRIKQGDLAPSWSAHLYDAAGPVPLTSAVEIRVKGTFDGVQIIDRVVAGDDDGLVQMEWAPGDTDTPGVIRFEVQVTWPGNRPQTFPARGTVDTVVYPDSD